MQGHVYLQSWRRALRRHGLTAAEELAYRGELSERGGYGITQAVLSAPSSRRPTAILFQSDCMAIGAYRKLSEVGLRPGRDLAISGGVLTGELAEYLSPQLTGFRISLRPLGERLAEALLPQLADPLGREGEKPVQERWPLELLARGSDEGAG